MLHQINNDQLETLRQHLIVPLAVNDILHHDLDVEAEMQYGLHMALSEIDPDSALLAIAICARHIAEKNNIRSALAATLLLSANNIIDEYGPDWLHHHQNGPMAPEDFELILQNVPEDLESIADLMDVLSTELDAKSCSADLINLLSIQARAHMEIADYVLAEIAYERAASKEELEPHDPVRELIDMDAYKGNNVIVFPGAA